MVNSCSYVTEGLHQIMYTQFFYFLKKTCAAGSMGNCALTDAGVLPQLRTTTNISSSTLVFWHSSQSQHFYDHFIT